MAGAEDHLFQGGDLKGIPEVHASNQAIGGNVKETFGPSVDVSDGVIRRQDHPALGGRVNPGQKLGSVQDERALLLRSPGRQDTASTLQKKHGRDASRKAQCRREQHRVLSRSGTRSRGPYGSVGGMRAPPQPFPAASECEHPLFWCHQQNQHPRFFPEADRDSRRAWGSE